MRDAVIVGAGHAGLAVSQRLAAAGVDHVVLERGEIGETWRTQRWDSFRLNTADCMNALPGQPGGGSAERFAHRDEWVATLESYARDQRLPVRTHANVTSVERDADGAFTVTVDGDDRIRSKSVVVASGVANTPNVPPAARGLDPRIEALTTATYRRPAQLPEGAVLVVGGAQSGTQIAEELLEAGRRVYLATGRVGRCPRRLRGRDALVWLTEVGWMTQRPSDLPDPAMMRAAQPLISGVGPRGHTVSLQSLASRGVTLLGHFEGADGPRLRFADDLAGHVKLGDEMSAQIRKTVDEYLAKNGLDAPATEPDPADAPVAHTSYSSPTTLDAGSAGIRSVIFSVGFATDRSWLRCPTLAPDGSVMHDQGRSPVDGLFFVGLLWMRMRRSGIIHGAMDDSAFIADQVQARAG